MRIAYHKLIAVSGSLFFELFFELSFLQGIGNTVLPNKWGINSSGNYAILVEKATQHQCDVISGKETAFTGMVTTVASKIIERW